KNSANIVSIKISKSKTRKIKRRIVLSFINYKKNGDFKLLLDRIYYLSTLRTVKRSKNGNLLAGNAFNYMYATNFNDLKKIDCFYLNLVGASRFSLSASQRLALQKISFYRMAAKRKVMNITRKRTLIVKEAWIND